MDRRSTFSDPGIIRRLQTEFIPAAGNCAEWQHGRTATARWFMGMAGQTEYLKYQRNGTTQGFYIASPDGAAYGWLNSRDLARINAFMDQALEKHRGGGARAVTIADGERREAHTRTPEKDTSVIRVFSRIRPLPPDAGELNHGVGRDHLWIFAREVRELLAAADRTRGEFPLPATLAGRLVRFHLIDNVRGEPDMWNPAHVKRADFAIRETRRTPKERHFRLEGRFAQQTNTGERGQEGWLQGELTVDPATETVTRFRAYSEGQAWGRSRYTGGEPKGRFPLVIAMTEVNDAVSRVVPPQAIWMRDEYDHPRLSPETPAAHAET